MKAYFFVKQNGRSPLVQHIQAINDKIESSAIHSAIDRLMDAEGRLPFPIAEHIIGKIWALRSYYGNQRIYYCLDDQSIILLDGYKKKSMKIDRKVLRNIQHHYQEYLQTKNRLEYLGYQ